MKAMCLLLALFFSGCAVYNPVPVEERVITKEAVLPGMTKEQIFTISKVWIERHLYSEGDVIQATDEKTGMIVAAGFIDYPASGKLDEVDRIQYTISFWMREDIRNEGIRLSFYDLLLDIPKYYYPRRSWTVHEFYGGYSVPVEHESDFAAARRGLLELADRLIEYLQASENNL